MTTFKRTRTIFLAILLAIPSLAGAQAQAPSLTDRIPAEPQITIGQLPNGLKYYVRANKKPEKRAELRLVVKAGSVLESDDQQGLAHFVEHMAFNGTEHFPKNEIVKFIESLGMRFGADLNAYTSFDETVYMLQVPTDKPEVMDKALLVLEDWAHKVSFDPQEIDKERGVVMKSGDCDAAPTPGRPISCFRFSSKVRSTRTASRLESLRLSRTSSRRP